MSKFISPLFITLIALLSLQESFAGTLTLQVKKPNHSVFLRNHKDILEFRPNASLHWGVKLSGNFFYIEYGQKIKDTNYSGKSVGNNSYKSYRIGIPIANTYTEIYYEEWRGFSSDESDDSTCHYCVDRPNLSSRDRGIQFQIATDSTFSMKALASNGSMGVKLSASPIITVFGNRLKYHDGGGIVQNTSDDKFSFYTDMTTLEMNQLGGGLGYGVLVPFGPLYFGLSAIVGAAYQKTTYLDLQGQQLSGTSVGTHWSAKAMLASHGPGLNFGLKAYAFANVYNVADDKSTAALNYKLYAYTSYSW